MNRLLLLTLCLLMPLQLFSQDGYFSGRVIDSVSHEPLAFVNIVYNTAGQGVVTNLDGIFRIPRSGKVQFLNLRYVGYRQKSIPMNPANYNKGLVITLSPEPIDIGEVIVYPTENPAHRIIRLAAENRLTNHPEKAGPFSYISYDKMVFNLDTSGVSDVPDTIRYGMDGKSVIDLKRFLDKQYLFMMESVSSRKFLSQDKNKDEIIASKVSGIAQPSFMVMVRQFQSSSFYDNFINIANRQLLNPISTGSTDKYFFLIQDTVYTHRNDTVFIISFRPRQGKNFEGMQGVLYINSHGYAVQNVLAEAHDQQQEFMKVSIQQQYELVEGKRWFPVQLNTSIEITRNPMGGSMGPMKMTGTGKSYIANINFSPQFDSNEFSDVQIEVNPNAHKQPEEIWNTYRTDSLNSMELETYRVIDSIGKAEHLDRTITSAETLLTGYLPGRYFSFDLRRFIGYNPYEGFRFGAGGITTSQFSERFTPAGYVAYSLGDKAFKYSGSLTLNIVPDKELGLTLLYRDDVRESGGIRFNETWSLSGSAFFRNYMVEVMDKTEEVELSLNFRAFRFLTGKTYLIHSELTPTSNYGYIAGDGNPQLLLTRFYITEAGVSLRYAYNETFMKTPRGNRFSMGTRYPVLFINLARGMETLYGDFTYWRTEFKVTRTFTTKSLGDTRMAVVGGMVTGSVPYSKLYAGQGSYRKFTVEAEHSFGTMRFNEFLSDRFIALFIKQDFGKLLFKPRGKFQPEIALVHNMGFGSLSDKSPHDNIEFKTLEKGYFEGGLLINNIFRLQILRYGVGVLYRYGPNAFTKTIDNFAFKLTLQFSR
ncbi:MAG TPA: DUF5686 family protein [Bacteroidales bacterium]|nr:DUF5686 family protein [Bacteroidales bacterium]